jgi:hypothetical protein
MKGVIQNFDQKAKGNRVMENIGTDERIILRWILKKQSVRCGQASSDSGHSPMMSFYEHRNKHFDSI